MSTLTTGTMLEDRYRIARRIASGGMATVYVAIDTRLDREVAVKVMEPSFASDEAFRMRFAREARAVARLKHPNLVDVFDQGIDEETSAVFLVMELVDGGSLRELLKDRGPMPPHAALSAMHSVLMALTVAHSHKMIHRDIKPDNVLLTYDSDLKLADFGLVRALNSTDQTTRETEVIGTVAYLSPEQVRGVTLTQASDVYSAGIMLFELLTGRVPFRGDSPTNTALARLSEDVPPPSHVRPGIPPEVDKLVIDACRRDPEQRFSDGREFLNALERVIKTLGIRQAKLPLPRHSAVRDAITASDFGERTPWHDISSQVLDLSDVDPMEAYPESRFEDQTAEESENQSIEANLYNQDTSGAEGREPLDSLTAEHTRTLFHPPAQAAPAESEGTRVQLPIQAPPTSRHLAPERGRPGTPPVSPGGKLTNRGIANRLVWTIVLIIAVISVALGSWWITSGRFGEIPVVVGLDEASAQAAIQEAGFTSDVEEQYSDDVARDEAIGTDPPFGERAPRGSRVAVLISLGRPEVPTVGVADSREAYEAKLAERTLTAELGDEVYSDSVTKGLVAKTTPSAGSVVDTGSPVTIHLSKGPEPKDIRVPMVLGKRPDEAKKTLEEAGFKVEVSGTATIGRGIVIMQDPSPLSHRTSGDTVKITII